MIPLVSIQNLSKTFPGVRALNNCRFDLAAGEVHALMGENGAGKSTLMKVLAGVYQKDEGEIRIDGQLVDIPSPRAAQSLGIGIIHQELNLMNHRSVAQNIFIGREPRGRLGMFIDSRKMDQDTRKIFDLLHLDLDPRTLVGELTVAKQQMVEIAKALSFESRVLIMDEPTAALNNVEIDDLFRIIRQLKDHGVGIVYISHKMDELKRISDRVTVMRDGQYIGTVPTAGTSMDTIISMMVGRTLFESETAFTPAADHEVVLEVRKLNRGRTIKDVNFVVRKGEILGFAGLMGAGRTEVARAVFGADKVDSGEILVRGEKVSIHSPADAVKRGIGYLSEDRKHFGLATGMDVESNIVLATMRRFLALGFFLRRPIIRDTAASFVKRLGIKTPSISQKVALLSGGNQQKIVRFCFLMSPHAASTLEPRARSTNC
jgi:ribose transport system ATP-binding protein